MKASKTKKVLSLILASAMSLALLEAGLLPQPASSARDIAEARIRDSTFLVLLAFIFSPP